MQSATHSNQPDKILFNFLLFTVVVFFCINEVQAQSIKFKEWLINTNGSSMKMELKPITKGQYSNFPEQFAPVIINDDLQPLVGMYRRMDVEPNKWKDVEIGKQTEDYITVNNKNIKATYFQYKNSMGRPFLLVIARTKKGQGFLLNLLKDGELTMGRTTHLTPYFSEAWKKLKSYDPI